jgi:hypothetical protein
MNQWENVSHQIQWEWAAKQERIESKAKGNQGQ